MWAIAQVMVLVKIMLTVLIFDPRSLDTFTLPKSALGHATSLLIAALLLWLFLRHGRATLVWSPVHAAVGALLLAFAVATPFAADPAVALFGIFKRYLGLTQMLDNGLLYLATAILFRDLRSLRLLVGVSVGVAVPVLAYALVQRLGLDPFTFVQGPTRIPITTLGNPDIAGAFVSVIGVTAASLAYLLPGPGASWQRLAVAVIGAACVAALYTTGVRAGVIAIAGGWLATVLLAVWMPWIPRRRALVAVGIGAALAVAIAVSPVGARLRPDYLRSDLSVITRIDIYTVAMKAIVERPVLGWGPDNYAVAYPARRTESSIPSGLLENSTHDMWLYVATSAGVVGAAALLLLVVLLIDRAVRLARRGDTRALALVPLAAYLAQALVNVNEIAVDWIFWTSAGVIGGASARAILSRRRPRPFVSARALGIVSLAAAIMVAVISASSRITAGEAMLGAEAFANAHRGGEAVAYGEAVVKADPRRAESWSSYGAALYAANAPVAAVMAFTRAADQQSWHPLSWDNLALAWAALGDQPAAYAAAQRAPVADPYDGLSRELLAQIAYGQKDYTRSAVEGEKAIKYEFPPRDSAYFTTISAYVQLKDYANAEHVARAATQTYQTLQLRLQLAAILIDEGKKPDALTVLSGILQEQPNNADALRLKEIAEGSNP